MYLNVCNKHKKFKKTKILYNFKKKVGNMKKYLKKKNQLKN